MSTYSLTARVGVLFGGTSTEREISLKGGLSVYDSLRKANINAVAVDLQKDEIEQIRMWIKAGAPWPNAKEQLAIKKN